MPGLWHVWGHKQQVQVYMWQQAGKFQQHRPLLNLLLHSCTRSFLLEPALRLAQSTACRFDCCSLRGHHVFSAAHAGSKLCVPRQRTRRLEPGASETSAGLSLAARQMMWYSVKGTANNIAAVSKYSFLGSYPGRCQQAKNTSHGHTQCFMH